MLTNAQKQAINTMNLISKQLVQKAKKEGSSYSNLIISEYVLYEHFQKNLSKILKNDSMDYINEVIRTIMVLRPENIYLNTVCTRLCINTYFSRRNTPKTHPETWTDEQLHIEIVCRYMERGLLFNDAYGQAVRMDREDQIYFIMFNYP